MGNAPSVINKINFEDIQNMNKSHRHDNANKYGERPFLINTLPPHEQNCLIVNTINMYDEEKIINNLLNAKHMDVPIYIYGKNTNDATIFEKFFQLQKLGFTNLYLYLGGMFEWLCLQDIYGSDTFHTTSCELDIYKYRPVSSHNIQKRLT